MNILDTNLCVFGTLGTHEQAVDWPDAIEAGETTFAISAYMVQEALDALIEWLTSRPPSAMRSRRSF